MNSRRSLNSEENDSATKKIDFQKRKSIELKVFKLNEDKKQHVKTQESQSSNSVSRDTGEKVQKALQDQVKGTMTQGNRTNINISESNSEFRTYKKASLKKRIEQGSKNKESVGMKESMNITSEEFTKKTVNKYDSQMSQFSKKSNDSGTISQTMKGKEVLSPKIKHESDDQYEPRA